VEQGLVAKWRLDHLLTPEALSVRVRTVTLKKWRILNMVLQNPKAV
jgi:hypothetical protein